MATRIIRTANDPILRKTSKPVLEMTERISMLIDDLFETMYEAGGVGLAAPQVGVLKDIFVVDCGMEEREPYALINPVITGSEGEETALEGCLSVPGYQGEVTRAGHISVTYLDRDMHEQKLEAEGLLARAIQHEYDHLEGVLYTDKLEGELMEMEKEEP